MDTSDYFFINLNTIAQIEEYDKLGLKMINNETKLIVDKYSYISFLTRRYNGYDRISVLDYLKDFINKLEKFVELLIKGNLNEHGDTIISAIDKACKGLINLKNTYNYDSNIVSEISLLIFKLNNFTSQLKEMNVLINYVASKTETFEEFNCN